MEHIRTSIVQARVVCTEYDEQVPSRILGSSEYTGTCFRVDHRLFPFGEKVLFLTNFHVCDNADERRVHLRTASMGKNALTGYVEAVVPQLDCAVISVCQEHDRWYLDEDPREWIEAITVAPLCLDRISTTMHQVSTIGFPQGLEEQLSSGWLAGRGSDDMDMLQLNISINSGNSGGPLFDKNGKVIGICTATLNESEGIAFAVPIFSVLSYFEKYYESPFGRFPQWGFELMPMTDAFAEEYNIRSVGAVVNTVIKRGVLQKGDVLHAIDNGNFRVELDRFGLIRDETRGSKITVHNTEFLMRLTPGKVKLVFTRKGVCSTVHCAPSVIDYKVVDTYREWNPPQWYAFGDMTLQSLSKNLLTDEAMTAEKLVDLVEHLKRTRCLKETVVVSYVKPGSYLSSLELPQEFDVVSKIGRCRVRGMEHCRELLEDVRVRWLAGEQKRVCLQTSSGDVWLNLDQMWTRKRKR